jgi:hypothetical protein
MRQFGSGFPDTLAQMAGPFGFGSAFAGGQGLHLSDLMGPTENGFGQMPELDQMIGPFEFGKKGRKRKGSRKGSKGRKGSRKGSKGRKGRKRGSKGRKRSEALELR